MHHRRMVQLIVLVGLLVVTLGALYGYVTPIGPWDGMYFAVVTVTTVGYGDIVPRGWEAHLVALMIMILIIPLWSSVFALLATGFTANHIDRKTDRQTKELKEHIGS